MALSNSEVAKRFVKALPGKGSNTESAVTDTGVTKFVSYSTTVTYIRDNNLYLSANTYSNSTARQMSYIRSAWREAHPGEAGQSRMYTVADMEGGNSYTNRKYRMDTAQTALDLVVAPRRRMTTRIMEWNNFLLQMAELDRVLALPHYTGVQQITEAERLRMARLNAVRYGASDANPPGLDEALLLRVKAICALEGAGT